MFGRPEKKSSKSDPGNERKPCVRIDHQRAAIGTIPEDVMKMVRWNDNDL